MKKVTIWAALLGASTMAACATAADQPVAASAAAAIEEESHGPHLNYAVSQNDFDTTLTKLQAGIDSRGFKTFAVIDHAKGAASVDAELRPTTLVIFGNPKGGTPLIQSSQTMGIVLPLKALVYQTEDGAVTVATPDIRHSLKEHGVEGKEELTAKIEGALAAISGEATQ